MDTLAEDVSISPRAKKLANENKIDWTKVQPSGNDGQRIIERDVIDFLASRPKISPVANKIANETGIDLTRVQGSGPGGRVMKTDILRAIETRRPYPDDAADRSR